MKCRLVIDCNALVHPDWDPPKRADFASDREFHDAMAIYKLDHSPEGGIIPAGTVIEDPLAWILCFFHDHGPELATEIDTVARTKRPVRVAPGTVKAEPLDDACKAALELQCRKTARSRKCDVQVIRDEVAADLAASRARQGAKDAARDAKEGVA